MHPLQLLLHGNEPDVHAESLFWEGLLFSAVTIGIVVALTWWLYFSPLKKIAPKHKTTSKRLEHWLVLLIGLSSLMRFTGAFWDRSEHIITGIVPGGEDFLWPPHIMLYASFLMSLLVALGAAFILARPYQKRGVYDPRVWIRQNPYVGAIALAGFYGIASVPGDAIWHELYGIDLTAWSPPHLFLALASAVESVCAAGLLVQHRPEEEAFNWRDLAVTALLAISLSLIMMIGVTEWEATRPFDASPIVLSRPIWLYPLVTAGLAFFWLQLARMLSPWRWMATTTTLLFLFIRFANMSFMSLIDGVSPELPLMFILGAILLDLAPWGQISVDALRYLSMAAAFTAGFYVLAVPPLADPSRGFDFLASDYALAVASTLVVAFLLAPVAEAFGRWFRDLPGAQDAIPAAGETASAN